MHCFFCVEGERGEAGGWWGGGGGGVHGLMGGEGRPCRTRVLTRKLSKAAARPAANDGCYSLTTRLVAMMVALINQELTNTQPVHGEGFTARA